MGGSVGVAQLSQVHLLSCRLTRMDLMGGLCGDAQLLSDSLCS